MPIHARHHISYLTADSLAQPGIVHGFFMRHGGCSPAPWKSLNMATSVGDSPENVIENRKRLAKALNISEGNFFDVWQIHGNAVISAKKPRPIGQDHQRADAIMTNRKNVFLLMLFADCFPIMISDPLTHTVGIAHAGWKGALNNVVGELVQAMARTYHTSPKSLRAVIGPGICAHHYEVGEGVALQFRELFSNQRVLVEEDGKFYLDLGLANEINLKKEGVDRIERLRICTHCRKDDWFSHRGEGGKTGRYAAVIGMRA